MCRNIQTLFNFEPPATDDEVRAASLQYVRKISGFTKPSQANEQAFERAVDEVTEASMRLLGELVTTARRRTARSRRRAAARGPRSASPLPDLDGSFDGEIVRPGDPGYDSARVVWNGLADRHPALIVRPAHADDVISALRFAREEDLLVAVRCGGHSIPGLSTCDDGIVIDLSRMRGVDVDPEQRTARAAGGALLAELDDQAQAVRARLPRRGGLAHGRRRTDPRRWDGSTPAEARAHDRQPPLGRARDGGRPPGAGERRREPRALLGLARRRRELRDRDILHVPPRARSTA